MTRPQEHGQDGRTRQAQLNRERIYQAAVSMFVARGYDKVTMEEIAREAGVTRRTAFNHFSAKADIATEWAVRCDKEAPNPARSANYPARHVLDRIRGYFHDLAVLTERDWQETLQMTTVLLRGHGVPHHRSWVSGELREWLADWLDNGPEQGGHYKGIDPALITNVLYDIFQGALLRWIPQPAPLQGQFAEEVDTTIGLLLTGLDYAAENR